MRGRDYDDIRAMDGGEARVWMDGQIEILKDSPRMEGFKAARDRLAAADEDATRTLAGDEWIEGKVRAEPSKLRDAAEVMVRVYAKTPKASTAALDAAAIALCEALGGFTLKTLRTPDDRRA